MRLDDLDAQGRRDYLAKDGFRFDGSRYNWVHEETGYSISDEKLVMIDKQHWINWVQKFYREHPHRWALEVDDTNHAGVISYLSQIARGITA